MNNRLAMALAVAGGYVVGRTKKGKMALGLGGMVLGKRLKLSPQTLTRMASEQLQNNPQLKALGDQLRQDLRGVGKAATGAVVTRRIDGIADALHQRTLNVQDQLSGAVPDEARLDKHLRADDEAEESDEDQAEAEGSEEEEEEAEGTEGTEGEEEEDETSGREDTTRTDEDDGGREQRRPAARTRKTAGQTAGRAAGTAGKTAKPARRTAPGKAPTAKKRTAATKSSAGARGTADRARRGGEGRG